MSDRLLPFEELWPRVAKVVTTLATEEVAVEAAWGRVLRTAATAAWDLFWKLVTKHGFDPDLYGGTGGRQAHLFAGMTRGLTGAVIDMAVLAEDARVTAVRSTGSTVSVPCARAPIACAPPVA